MRTFRATGREVRGVDIKASPFTDAVGSITDRSFVRDAMAGVSAVIHTATLHKPHVATHANRDFVETNITGTLNLLEEATATGVRCFIFTSTTSTFGSAMRPQAGQPAAWVTEDVVPVARNIYGVTKLAAESLCELFARQHRLPSIVLRTSRFFPEADDDAGIRGTYRTENAQANELLYRRIDIADVVSAHLAALDQAQVIGFGRFIVSATTPFSKSDLPMLHANAAAVVDRLFPECAALYDERGWKLFPTIDRVYVNRRAVEALEWRPRHDFAHVLDCLRNGNDFRSGLARQVGSKGYHDVEFDEGPYPVA